MSYFNLVESFTDRGIRQTSLLYEALSTIGLSLVEAYPSSRCCYRKPT